MASIDVTFNNEMVERHTLDQDTHVIGRQEGCEIWIDNLGISRNHARIVREGGVFRVEDMGSSNGTFVNGEKVQQHNLNEGDEISVGKYVLVYHAGEGEEAAAAPVRSSDTNAIPGPQLPGDGALNTMAMDGDAIRKRLQAMHEQKAAEGESEGTPTVEGQKAPPAIAAAEAKARKAEAAMAQSGGKGLKVVIALVVVVVIALLIFLLTRGG